MEVLFPKHMTLASKCLVLDPSENYDIEYKSQDLLYENRTFSTSEARQNSTSAHIVLIFYCCCARNGQNRIFKLLLSRGYIEYKKSEYVCLPPLPIQKRVNTNIQ